MAIDLKELFNQTLENPLESYKIPDVVNTVDLSKALKISEILNKNFEYWTGSSDIHTSIAHSKYFFIPHSGSLNKYAVASYLVNNTPTPDLIYSWFTKAFGNAELLLDQGDFRQLMMFGLIMAIQGKSEVMLESMKCFKNPNTGNVFYLVGLQDDLIFGIRFWMTLSNNNEDNKINLHFGFRVRIEFRPKNVSEMKVRLLSGEQKESVIQLHEENKEVLIDVEQEILDNIATLEEVDSSVTDYLKIIED